MNRTEDIQPGTLAPPTGAPPSPVDPRVVRALEEYSAALKAGQRPDRHEFQARYPEVAAALAECLEGLEFVQAAAPLLEPPGGGQHAGASDAAAELCSDGRLGDYRILREVGRGGMGVVYEAMQISLGRQVALKVLPFAATLDTKQLQRFKNEALAAAQLHHQNIVPVYGVGCERGVHYYAMQFIDGQTLAAMIAELRRLAGLDPEVRAGDTAAVGGLVAELASGRWEPPQRVPGCSQPTGSYTPLAPGPEPAGTASPPDVATATAPPAALPTDRSTRSTAFFRTVATLGVQAAEALEHAHQLGVVHRDIKPANLLVDTRGNLWITDFGLAHSQSQAGLTMTGDLVGTLRYMSPEQALARRVVIDHHTDVYSLGATLYELLTLEPVFNGRDRQELLRQIAFEEPKAPQRLNTAMPVELETIVLKALEKNPADRYATAQELADDLGRFLKDESIRAKRPSPLQRARKWARRHPGVVWTAVVALALLLVTIAVGASLAAWRLNQEQNATRDQLRLTEQAQEQAGQAQEQAMRRLYDARLAQAQALRLSGRMGQRFESLKAIQEAARIRRAGEPPVRDAQGLRSEAVACLALADMRVFDDWPIPTHWQSSIAFDAELVRYAYGDDQGDIHVRRTAGHQEIAHLSGPGRAFTFLWTGFSPDGRYLLVEYHLEPKKNHCLVWELAAQNNPRVALRVDNSYQFQFSPDSRSLAIGRQDGTLALYDLSQGTARTLCRDVQGNQLAFRPDRNWGSQLAFSPDGKQLAFSDEHKPEIWILDVATAKLVQPLPHVGENTALAWSSDNRFLAAASDNKSIYIWNVPERRQQGVLVGHQDWVGALAFHPAGYLLVSASADGSTRLWDLVSGRQLVSSPGWFHNFSPDGGRLSFRKGTRMGVWEVADGRECRLLQPRTERTAAWLNYKSFESIDYSPDGRWLASVGGDGVRLWDTAAGREMAHLPIGYHETTLFHPRGSGLFTYGRAGLKSWPIASVPGKSEIQIGPPQTLEVRPNTFWFRACCSLDGRVLAVADDYYRHIIVLKVEAPSERVVLSNCSDVASLALSSDGTWVAAGLVKGNAGISIWDAHSGRLVQRWSDRKDRNRLHVAFSPDDQWLVTGGQGDYRSWKVGSWEPGPVIARDDTALYAGPVAFSRDGRLLATTGSPQMVQLFDFANQRELATLSAPDAHMISRLCFNHDSTELAASTANHVVQLWDLRAIRRQLQEMNLDWDLPTYPPAPEVKKPQPLRIQVDLGDPAELMRNRQETARRAIAQKRRALEANPNSPTACNNLAWTYLTTSEGLRDCKAALPLAQKAVQLDPNPMNRNTLGLAYYRAGRYREAVEALQANLKDQVDGALGCDLYFLAMSHHQLGESARARQFYDLAVRWSGTHQEALAPCPGELTAIHAEAAGLLEVKEKKD